MARKVKGPPWIKLGDGKPIERFLPAGFVLGSDDVVERDARAEQYRRMVRLKEHFGIEGEAGCRPWYELALALASARDPALTIVDPPRPRTDKTAARARSAEGLQLVQQIEYARQAYRAAGQEVSIIALLAEHQEECERYSRLPLEGFERFYYRAHAHWTSKRGCK